MKATSCKKKVLKFSKPLAWKKIQYGFTLIELMVGLLLGVLLMSATINIFITTKQTYTAKENTARALENANFAFEIMRQVINLTGSGWTKDDKVGAVKAASSSSLTAGYKGLTGRTDCLGRPAVTTTSTYFNQFYVDTSTKQLFCEVTEVKSDLTTTTEKQPLIDNIKSMEIYYGEDTDDDGVANSYTLTPADLNTILSAQVKITVIVDPLKKTTKDIEFVIAMQPRILSKLKI